ncbi:MAG: DEAD/DEAH box helicase [Acidobacteriota bacterium]
MPLEGILRKLRRHGDKQETITAWRHLPARPARSTALPEWLSPALRAALQRRGIESLYSHQTSAIDLVRDRHHVVVVTPTASGKTLCYNVPVLDEWLRDNSSRALYIFPTKALAQDQMAELERMGEDLPGALFAHTYDGDTPSDLRLRIRGGAHVVLTNPDMLHTAILPHHTKWAALFQNLHYVVVDEMHTYRGVFGSHFCNVLRRLRRIAAFYGSTPRFLFSSATIANPGELAELLLEEPVAVVADNGAPSGSKDFIFYNPPMIRRELGIRGSATTAARRLAGRFLKENIQTIIFAGSRLQVEVLVRYLKQMFSSDPRLQQKLRGYRGGYLPNLRREIEKGLREGDISGVVSTNALELGIDIGSLQVCILAGYPGTIASAWQQAGRAGRRSEHSAAILVARNLPLDQFIINNPEYFFDQSPEFGRIHPDNLHILLAHIKCAAFELPFTATERFGSEDLEQILKFLEEDRFVHRSGDRWHWTQESYPAESVSLRNLSEDNFVVFDRSEENRAIAEVDFDSAPFLIHRDAIYMHEGAQYHVEEMDYAGRKAYVRPVTVDYYTQAVSYSGIRILDILEHRHVGPLAVEHGEIHLFEQFPGFKKIKFYTSENVGYGTIDLPRHEMHSTGYWFTIPAELADAMPYPRADVIEALLGLSYGLQHLAALTLMCDIHDVGRSVGDRSAEWVACNTREGLGVFSPSGQPAALDLDSQRRFEPTLFLYDNHPAGVGFSAKLYETHEALLVRALQMVEACPCPNGCPSCVGPINETHPLKKIVRELLPLLSPATRRKAM